VGGTNNVQNEVLINH